MRRPCVQLIEAGSVKALHIIADGPLFHVEIAPLLIEINTRYGWVASPYPTGTCTPQETPSFARRDNDKALMRAQVGEAHCSASAGAKC